MYIAVYQIHGKTKRRKHAAEATAKLLAECSRAENMNELEYIRYLLLNRTENPRSKEMEKIKGLLSMIITNFE